MSEIRNLTRNGETFYPLTHEKAVIGMEEFKDTITEQIDNYRPIEITGDVTNAPDEEDITSDSNNLLKFKNRNNLYGLGKVILRRGSSFASQVTQANTIYVIQYNFDLGNDRINIPNGSILLFEGGALSNGTLVCADLYDVRLVYYQDQSEILSSVTLEGNFIHKACDKDTIREILVDNSSITKDANDVLSVKANGIQNSHLNSNVVDNSSIALDTNNKISIKDGGVTGSKLSSEVVNTDDLSIVNNKIQFANRGTTNGMGKIILRKDQSFASQLTQQNTIYVIQYDFDLGGVEITIPENCVLKFEGGSLNNGTLQLNNTEFIGLYSESINCLISGVINTKNFVVSNSTKVVNTSKIEACRNGIIVQGDVVLDDSKNTIVNTSIYGNGGKLYWDTPNNKALYINSNNICIEGVEISKPMPVSVESQVAYSRAIYSLYYAIQLVNCKLNAGVYIGQQGFVTSSVKPIIGTIIKECTFVCDFTYIKGEELAPDVISLFGAFGARIEYNKITANNVNRIIKASSNASEDYEDYYNDTILRIIGNIISAVCVPNDGTNGTGKQIIDLFTSPSHILIEDNIIDVLNHYCIIENKTSANTHATGKQNEICVKNNRISTNQSGFLFNDDNCNVLVENNIFVFKEDTDTNNSAWNYITSAKNASIKCNTIKANYISKSKNLMEIRGNGNISFVTNIFDIHRGILTYAAGNFNFSGNVVNSSWSGSFFITLQDIGNLTVFRNIVGDAEHTQIAALINYNNSVTKAGYISFSGNAIHNGRIISVQDSAYNNVLLKKFKNPYKRDGNYIVEKIIYYNISDSFSRMPSSDNAFVGSVFYVTDKKKPVWCSDDDTLGWREADSARAGVKRSGTFSEVPNSADIYEGFQYFCTDRKIDPSDMSIITPVVPDTGGMSIIHKGSNVWVDALGRVVQ